MSDGSILLTWTQAQSCKIRLGAIYYTSCLLQEEIKRFFADRYPLKDWINQSIIMWGVCAAETHDSNREVVVDDLIWHRVSRLFRVFCYHPDVPAVHGGHLAGFNLLQDLPQVRPLVAFHGVTNRDRVIIQHMPLTSVPNPGCFGWEVTHSWFYLHPS